MSPRSRLTTALVSALLVSGCMTAARAFLDIPEEDGRSRARDEQAAVSMEMLDSIIRALQAGPDLPPPPIEAVTDPDSLLALLPTDRAGGVDWVAAVEEGVIRPRPSRPNTPADSTQVFPFDIYLSQQGGARAYFPHSVHQSWLSCQSCHPNLYAGDVPSASAETTHGTESCGMCHNGIAFPIASCERCHDAATDLPADRLTPTLGGTLTMLRAPAQLPDNSDRDVFGASGDFYEPAVFPHGAHRVRFQCKACHEKPFPMEGGATRMSQEQAHTTQGCGYCHNGRIAFDTGMSDCYRCHVEGGGAPQGSG
jgi:c(7)-type cytochrome triheme protein